MLRQTPVATPMTARRAAPTSPVDPVSDAPAADALTERSSAAKRASSELGPIIKSKIQPPALRPTTLTRQRLIDQLREATSHRLTLLIAEAGYGKTTLLADFARVSGIRTMWYRLDANDADVVDWVSYLIAAARTLGAQFGQATENLIRESATGGPPPEAFVASLISDLTDLEACPTLLVFDDFQAVDQIPGALELIARLARDAPPWLRLLISSRTQPAVEFGRLAMAGDLAELHTDDLRFVDSEIADLFSNSFGIPLDQDVLTTLGARTMGWAASLQLFYGSIRGRPPSDVRTISRALSGATNPVYAFLAQEVLTNVSPSVRSFLIRASLLDRIATTEVTALLADWDPAPDASKSRSLIEEADRVGLLTSSSISSDARQMHPLQRDFFLELLQQEDDSAIRAMNLRVARAISDEDPLSAAHYFAQAGNNTEAMDAIDRSLIETIGSGRWGMASRLVTELGTVPAGPAVAAIRARQLMADGNLAGAAVLLNSSDVRSAAPDVRAVFRHTSLSLGWRLGDQQRMLRDLNAINVDEETPSILKDIARVLLDASPFVTAPTPLPALGKRLSEMADAMATEKLTLYSAIALHDSTLAYLSAGELDKALEVGAQALERFANLTFFAVEQLSTHTALAVCEMELGHVSNAKAHQRAALASGREMVDVPAELALLDLILGDTTQAGELAARAQSLQHQNQSDAVADALLACALAFAEFRTNLPLAIELLQSANFDNPMELGYALQRDVLLAQSLLLQGRENDATHLIDRATKQSRARGARRSEVRLALLDAIARRDKGDFEAAVRVAHKTGALAALELADAIVSRIELLSPLPDVVGKSIVDYPDRWLPLIRRRLEEGGTPEARVAAALLDEFGTAEDVGRLRAFAKTYVKKGPSRSLGRALARRTSPPLHIEDLGPVALAIDGREVKVATIRRKSAAVLMYLITRPRFSANREQAIDAIWPDADPDSAINNLNQALFFLRRQIDPWYEDDLSVEYIELQGDLVWLDADLVYSDSAQFLQQAQLLRSDSSKLSTLLSSYRGQFAPEFEYEEWAMPWRGRVHATFLEIAHSICDDLVNRGDLAAARDVAGHVLRVDPIATDIELKLVWIYGRMGMISAANSLYRRLQMQDESEGLRLAPLPELLRGPLPPHQ